MQRQQYPYSVNIADLAIMPPVIASILLADVIPNRLQCIIDKHRADERAVVLETITAIRRAGADLIITYFAEQLTEWI